MEFRPVSYQESNCIEFPLMLNFEFVDQRRYNIRRFGHAIGYIGQNDAGEWYSGTLRQTLSAGELQEIVDMLNWLNSQSRIK